MKVLLPLLILFINLSCKKEKIQVKETENSFGNYYPNTLPFKNVCYWIYDNYEIDTNLNRLYLSTDSVKILKDTLINGNNYKMFNKWAYYPPSPIFLRDSLGYLIDNFGKIYYSLANFKDTLEKFSTPLTSAFSKMENKDTCILLKNQCVKVYDFKTTLFFDSIYPYEKTRYYHSFYNPTVGLVKRELFFTGSASIIISELKNYKINF